MGAVDLISQGRLVRSCGLSARCRCYSSQRKQPKFTGGAPDRCLGGYRPKATPSRWDRPWKPKPFLDTVAGSNAVNLHNPEGWAIYPRPNAITEPVHGLIKQAQAFQQFPLRGIYKVTGEFTLVALTLDLLKLWRTGMAPTG